MINGARDVAVLAFWQAALWEAGLNIPNCSEPA